MIQLKPKGTRAAAGLMSMLLMLLLTSTAATCGEPAGANVRILTDREYLPEVKRLIEEANRSVNVMMFEAASYPRHPSSPSNQLINAVIRAAKRGLKAEVILDVSNYSERSTKRNFETGRLMKSAGVDVVMDPEHLTTHTKMIIIDSKTVILGSTNWTFSALTKNHEISAVIDSEDIARQVLNYFRDVKKTGKKL